MFHSVSDDEFRLPVLFNDNPANQRHKGIWIKANASDGFRLMNVSVLLSDSMPCAGEGKVPVLFGDFSQIRIEDCGRDDLLTSTGDQCVMTGYMNCRIVDKEAISGIKII